jgi:hypothetical protein
MMETTIIAVTFGFGFLTGMVLGVIAMLKPLRQVQLELEAYKVAATPDEECRVTAHE